MMLLVLPDDVGAYDLFEYVNVYNIEKFIGQN